MQEPLALIALGSNLGDSKSNLLQAMDRLEAFSRKPLLRSSLWQTSPVDCPPGSPPFINAVIGLFPKPDETPESLLEKLQHLEREFGRKPKSVLNEARPLDLDLIAFGDEMRSTPRLILPHPRARERKFVLQPLSEIAPEFILPQETQTISRLLASLHTAEVLHRLG